MSWRFLNWETDDDIDFPSITDSGRSEVLTRTGQIISGTLSVTANGNQLPQIDFHPDDGSALDFFDAIAWRRTFASIP